MSRAYRISVSDTVRRHIKVEDGIQTELDLLPVLAPESMMDLLAAELENRGFERDGKLAVRKDPDGISITVDLQTATVTVRVAAESDVEISKGKSAVIEEEELDGAEDELKKKLHNEMQTELDGKQAEMQQEVTDQLKRKLQDIQSELDQVINKTTAAALKEKASQMGEIEEITEDDSGSLTIKVKV